MTLRIEEFMRKITLPKRYFGNSFIISDKFEEETDTFVSLLSQCNGEEFDANEKAKIQQRISDISYIAKMNIDSILKIFKHYENADLKTAQEKFDIPRTWRNILKPSEKTQIPALNFAIDALDYLGFKYSDLNAPADTFLASKISSKCDALISSSLCGDVSEKNITIVTEAHNLVDFLKDLKTNNCTVKDVTIKNLLPMDFLAKMICDRWAIQPGRNGYEYNAFNYGNVSSICDRIIELQRDPLFRNAFGVDGNEGISLEEIIKKTTKNKSMIILDFSSVAQEYLLCIVDSLLEQFLISALDGNYINEPHLLVLDEAHHYLKNTSSKDDNAYLGTSPGERIAKEGRKFGLHLLISTQRPRDLSSTIVSQIGTIISHALTNEQDKSIITSFGNYSDKSILNEISVLPRREAIIIGQAVSTSIRVKIDYLPENDRPKSKDPLENTFC